MNKSSVKSEISLIYANTLSFMLGSLLCHHRFVELWSLKAWVFSHQAWVIFNTLEFLHICGKLKGNSGWKFLYNKLFWCTLNNSLGLKVSFYRFLSLEKRYRFLGLEKSISRFLGLVSVSEKSLSRFLGLVSVSENHFPEFSVSSRSRKITF